MFMYAQENNGKNCECKIKMFSEFLFKCVLCVLQMFIYWFSYSEKLALLTNYQ